MSDLLFQVLIFFIKYIFLWYHYIRLNLLDNTCHVTTRMFNKGDGNEKILKRRRRFLHDFRGRFNFA